MAHTVLKWLADAGGWAELIFVRAGNHWLTSPLPISQTPLSVDLIIPDAVQEPPRPLTGLQTPCRSPGTNCW